LHSPVTAPYYPKSATGLYRDGYNYNEYFKLLTVNTSVVVASIPKIYYGRDGDFITSVIEYEECPTCDRLGFFEISKEILETADEALKSIKNLS